MGTRSTIGIVLNDETVKAVYCQFDGYLEHMGDVLIKHYNTYDKVLELVELGPFTTIYGTIDQCKKRNMEELGVYSWSSFLEYQKV